MICASVKQVEICRAYGYDPRTQLRSFTDRDARTQLMVHDVRTLRAVVAGYMFMAQVLRMVSGVRG